MKQHLLIATLIATLSLPLVSFAATYMPLVGIPGVDPAADFNSYINSLYALSISIAALLAVIKIIIAGVKWMMSDVVTTKGEAKKDIQGALFGLIIVIAAVLILNVINKDITNVDLTFKAPGTITSSSAAATPPLLDTDKIVSFSIPGTTAKVQYLANIDVVQQQLFSKYCEATISAFTDPQIREIMIDGNSWCITLKPTELVSLWPGTPETCKALGNNTGVYAPNPTGAKLPSGGPAAFCVWKKIVQ